MPEIILPCPASMNDAELLKLKHRFDDVCQSRTTPELFELCRAGSHLVDAIRAMLRALTWTHEPPKVAGWYWRSFKCGWLGNRWDEPSVVLVPGSNIGRFRGGKEVRWAGPIAPPVEG